MHACARGATTWRGMGWETRDGWPAAYLSQRPAAGAMHRRDVTRGVSAPTSATGAGRLRRLSVSQMGSKGRYGPQPAQQRRRVAKRAALARPPEATLVRRFGGRVNAGSPSNPRFRPPAPTAWPCSAQGRLENSRPRRRRLRRRKKWRAHTCARTPFPLRDGLIRGFNAMLLCRHEFHPHALGKSLNEWRVTRMELTAKEPCVSGPKIGEAGCLLHAATSRFDLSNTQTFTCVSRPGSARRTY